MNILHILTRTRVMVCFLMISFVLTAFSKSPDNAEIIKRIESLNTIIDVRITDEVIKQVLSTVENWRRDSETILGRSNLYFPVIENVLREKNLPDELKYVAVIESALLPSAKSNQSAVGMWQFMKGTAELFDLTVSKYIDERKDIIKSTDKATDYLQLLYETYGNWTIALAAYNCGTGRVNKAIRKAGGSKKYWDVAPYLPTETKRYIPRFIAAAYLMKYYELHDLNPRELSNDIVYTSTIKVYNKTDLKQLSKDLDVDFETVKYLNPMYIKQVIPEPKNDAHFTLTLPDHKMVVYINKFSSSENLVFNQTRPETEEVVAEIETIPSHPRTVYDYVEYLSSNFEMVRDNLRDSSTIVHLTKGILPGRDKMKLYQLGKKESLADVAESKNIPLEELIAINNIDETIGIPPGSIIMLSR